MMQNLSAPISEIVSNHRLKRIIIGQSDCEVYYVDKLRAYLKIATLESSVDLERERDVLEWLEDKLSVPEVLKFDRDESKTYLLISEITGLNAAEAKTENLLASLAESLRKIHDISIEDCPFHQNLTLKMAQAKQNTEKGMVDLSDVQSENREKSAEELYQRLIETKPLEEHLVFTHGDFCLPNIIFDNERVSGYIDWERGGIADCYQDIALLLRSFNFNVGTDKNTEKIFCEAYGIERLDYEKINFYILLDEFF
jgi:aminoglycoside phosphotransferase